MYDSVIRAESGVLWKNNAAVEMFICIPGIFLHFLIYKIRQDSGKLMHWLKYVVFSVVVGGGGGADIARDRGAIIPSQPPCYHIPIW